MSSWNLTLREMLISVSLLAVLLYIIARTWYGAELRPNTELHGIFDFQPGGGASYSVGNSGMVNTFIRSKDDILEYIEVVEASLSANEWQVLTRSSNYTQSEFIHFDRWHVAKEGTVGNVTLFYLNRSFWPNEDMIVGLGRYNNLVVVTDLWVQK